MLALCAACSGSDGEPDGGTANARDGAVRDGAEADAQLRDPGDGTDAGDATDAGHAPPPHGDAGTSVDAMVATTDGADAGPPICEANASSLLWEDCDSDPCPGPARRIPLEEFCMLYRCSTLDPRRGPGPDGCVATGCGVVSYRGYWSIEFYDEASGALIGAAVASDIIDRRADGCLAGEVIAGRGREADCADVTETCDYDDAGL